MIRRLTHALVLLAASIAVVILNLLAFVQGGGTGLTIDLVADRLERSLGWSSAKEE